MIAPLQVMLGHLLVSREEGPFLAGLLGPQLEA